MIHPAPNGFVGDRDAAFRQQIFDVAEAQGEPEIEPDRLMNDLWREPVSAVADLLDPLGYRRAKPPQVRGGVTTPSEALCGLTFSAYGTPMVSS
jgi:hypothetical protein